mmetsp:Transcript_54207/g.115715  ORF Transcript_54207/g.115715 Transcript_54207/m.115715 type:complete len:149 (-) Transcript_54207:324-770(-)|eukprot:CAMPEP_0206533634 /NCGR_PEP_ID=MMETSP0325_2-20121206/5075_1 /ASSEMBLY_ACC=CAM_ASM_000347 /TAXON_ID=2866 /ORGANISM="Crypthecodinium cohnii, Strain Seligo" /LENGTH=148 /DNA_ID=CAMNT_0054030301 /DNA_START=24 /DNA_END=470 /DNA_ORIENTATION=+
MVGIFKALSGAVTFVVSLACASLAAMSVCLLMAAYHDNFYGSFLSRGISFLADGTPGIVASAGLLLLPTSMACLLVKSAGQGSVLRRLLAAVLAGLVLGVLVSTPPALYQVHIADVDIHSRKNKSTAAPSPSGESSSQSQSIVTSEEL